jgi:hypothetical protein
MRKRPANVANTVRPLQSTENIPEGNFSVTTPFTSIESSLLIYYSSSQKKIFDFVVEPDDEHDDETHSTYTKKHFSK